MFLFAEVADSNLVSLLLDFKSNLLNWLLLIALLGWLYRKYVPPILTSRKLAIEADLKAAKDAKEAAEAALQEQKQKVEKADLQAKQIMVEAKEEAEQLRTYIKTQTDKDLTNLLHKFEQQAANEKRLAIAQMRQIAVKTAVKLAEENMSQSMTEDRRSKLLNDFIGQLNTIEGSNTLANEFKNSEVAKI
jgi:F-type H+-transporting ATPase subunit b